jgi:hypothetical protein
MIWFDAPTAVLVRVGPSIPLETEPKIFFEHGFFAAKHSTFTSFP